MDAQKLLELLTQTTQRAAPPALSTALGAPQPIPFLQPGYPGNAPDQTDQLLRMLFEVINANQMEGRVAPEMNRGVRLFEGRGASPDPYGDLKRQYGGKTP